MPQMMPIAWMQMYLLTNFVLLIIMAKTYFSKINKITQTTKINHHTKKMNWSW